MRQKIKEIRIHICIHIVDRRIKILNYLEVNVVLAFGNATIKGGGENILVWASFGSGRIGKLNKLDAKVTISKDIYFKVLEND